MIYVVYSRGACSIHHTDDENAMRRATVINGITELSVTRHANGTQRHAHGVRQPMCSMSDQPSTEASFRHWHEAPVQGPLHV